MFELCCKDVIYTRVTEIRGADRAGVLTGKTEDGMASKCFLCAKALFCTLLHYMVAQISSGPKPRELSPSTACYVHVSLMNYPDCTKRVDTLIPGPVKLLGKGIFLLPFLAKYLESIIAMSICLKSFCSTLP